MIDKNLHIKELYDLKHRHDKELHTHYDYEDKLFYNLTSKVLFKNTKLAEYIKQLQQLCVWSHESVLVVRNFFNWTVDKYYDRHNN